MCVDADNQSTLHFNQEQRTLELNQSKFVDWAELSGFQLQ